MASYEAKVTAKGQITLPSKVRESLRVQAGDKVVFSLEPDGSFHLAPKNRTLASLKGIVREGPKISGADIAVWIEEARNARAPNVKPRARRKRDGNQ